MPENPSEIESAFELAREGRVLDGIALYRRATGASLSETIELFRNGGRSAGAPPVPPLTPEQEVDRQLLAGRKIQAIQAYRRATGAGLADAKRAVEARLAELVPPGNVVPARVAAGSRSGRAWIPGLLVALLVVCVVLFLVTHR